MQHEMLVALASLAPAPKESVRWESTQHLFIEGENLEVLKLLYKSYYGCVKMIYDDETFFYICLDDEIPQAALDALPLDKETTLICLDTALDDAQKVNLAMQCLLKVI